MLRFDNIFHLKYLLIQIKGESYYKKKIDVGLIGYKFLGKLYNLVLRNLLLFLVLESNLD